MKKLSLLLSLVILINCFGTTTATFAADVAVDESIAMPDLGIEAAEVSADTATEIEELLSKMNELAIQSNTLKRDINTCSSTMNAEI